MLVINFLNFKYRSHYWRHELWWIYNYYFHNHSSKLFFTANYTKDDYYNRKNSYKPSGRKADCYNTARTKCNPQKIPSAHLFHNSKHLSLLHLLHTMKKISNRYSELKELFLYQQKF